MSGMDRIRGVDRIRGMKEGRMDQKEGFIWIRKNAVYMDQKEDRIYGLEREC